MAEKIKKILKKAAIPFLAMIAALYVLVNCYFFYYFMKVMHESPDTADTSVSTVLDVEDGTGE